MDRSKHDLSVGEEERSEDHRDDGSRDREGEKNLGMNPKDQGMRGEQHELLFARFVPRALAVVKR